MGSYHPLLSVFWNSLRGLRGKLQLNYVDICDKYNRVRAEIFPPLIDRDIDNGMQESRPRHRIQGNEETEETFLSTRQLPDPESFRLAPRPKDLSALTAEGPIITSEVTRFKLPVSFSSLVSVTYSPQCGSPIVVSAGSL